MKKDLCRHMALLFLGLLAIYSVSGQGNRYQRARDGENLLELAYIPTKKLNLPVGSIEILDARFDKEKIGTRTYFAGSGFYQENLDFPEGFSTYLHDKLAGWITLDSTSKDKLVLLVRNFRVTEDVSDFIQKGKRKELFFHFALSSYLQREKNCYRLGVVNKWFSSNDTRVNSIRLSKNEHEMLITNTLINTLGNLQFKSDSVESAFNRNQLDNALADRFERPIFNEKPRKGIFRTFQDFLDNKPTLEDYQVGRDAKGNTIILDKEGKRIESKAAWAISDGRQAYYLFGDNFYELRQRGNNYDLKATRTLNGRRVSMTDDLYSLGYITHKTRRAFNLAGIPEYIDLDLDTGDPYLEEIMGNTKVEKYSRAGN